MWTNLVGGGVCSQQGPEEAEAQGQQDRMWGPGPIAQALRATLAVDGGPGEVLHVPLVLGVGIGTLACTVLADQGFLLVFCGEKQEADPRDRQAPGGSGVPSAGCKGQR